MTDPFTSVYITDPLQLDLTEYLGTTTLQTTTFAIVQQETLTQTNYGLLLTSNYTITYTTMNRMPSEPSFLIQYPSTVQPSAILTTCSITYLGITYNLYGCAVDLSNLIITVTGGLSTPIA